MRRILIMLLLCSISVFMFSCGTREQSGKKDGTESNTVMSDSKKASGEQKSAIPAEARAKFDEAGNIPFESNADLIAKEKLYIEAIELYPGYTEALNNLGNVYESLGVYDKSLDYYTKAYESDPEVAEPYFGLGDIYFKLRNYEQSKKWYEEGMKIGGADERTQKMLKIIENMQSSKDIISAQEIIAALSMPVLRNVAGVETPEVIFPEKSIHFDLDSYEIRSDVIPQLDEMGKALQSDELRDFSFEIAGHTDSRGTEGYNQVLSEQRAESIKKYLTEHFKDIDPKRLVVKGYGESRPIDPVQDEKAYEVNRRVHLIKLESTAAGQKISLEASFYCKKDGNVTALKEGMTLTSKDSYQIKIIPGQDCFVYVYQKDSSGILAKLFPNASFNPRYDEGTNPLKKGEEYLIPGEGNYFKLDETKGEEKVYLVASEKSASDIEKAFSSAAAEGKSELFEQRLALRNVKGVGTADDAGNNGDVSVDLERFDNREDFYIVLTFKHE